MSGVRLEVQWSPVHPDKFITWGTEIFLYEVASLKDATKLACTAAILSSSMTFVTVLLRV
jgi:hypothetical protein